MPGLPEAEKDALVLGIGATLEGQAKGWRSPGRGRSYLVKGGLKAFLE